MADSRTFTLIGEFKDGITPELAKINRQLTSLKSSFGNLGGKGARNTSRDMGRLSASVSSLTENLKQQNQAFRSAVVPMREYRQEVGKTVSALKHLNAAGGNTRGLEATNKALREQLRLLSQVQSASARQGIAPSRRSVPRSPGGGGGAGRGGGGGGGGAGPGGFHMAEFGFAFTLGNAISQPIQSAIVSGFQIGVGLMTKPFQYFAGAFGERIKDELSDLKAAGGMLSISKKSENPFLKNIDDAIQYQQDTNKTFAKMAASLPGVTNDYVQVGKRLGDTAARIVNTDFAKAKAEAERIRATPEGAKFYGGAITGSSAEQQKEVIKTLLGELTKKTTIAGLGGSSGAGGIAGAYGLPGLTERMLSQQEVSMGQFQRYAAVFSDPTISQALQDNIDKINATQMNSVERFKAIQTLMDQIVTPELIEKLRTSVDGVYQGLRSAIIDPDTGLFGLGREFKNMGRRLNEYGQYVNEAGEVVTDMSKAAKDDLSIFEILRDIFSNAGQVLTPLVESLSLVFDPLKKVAKTLTDARHYAAQFNMTFNRYREGLKLLSKESGKEFLNETLDVRASFMAITNMLKQFGVIDSAEFQNISKQLGSKDLDIGAMMSGLLDKILNSKIAANIGETVGTIIGTVFSEVSKVTGFLSGRLEGSNKLFEGLKKGFEDAGGKEAFKNIFKDVFKSMFKILVEIMKMIPLEGYMLIGAMVVIPAAVQGLGMAIGSAISTAIFSLQGRIGPMIMSSVKKSGAKIGKGGAANAIASGMTPVAASSRATGLKTGISNAAFRPVGPRPPKGFENIALPGKAPRMVGGVTAPGRAPAIPKPAKSLTRTPLGPLAKAKGKGVGLIASSMVALSSEAPALAKAGKSLMSIGKGLPLLGTALTALDFGLRKAGGQDTAKAAGGAVGSGVGGAIGASLGTAIPIPVVGTVVGGVLGSMIGGWIGENIAPFFASLPAKLSAAWESLKVWFINLPVTLGYAIGQARANLEMTWNKFSTWWQSLGPKFDKWLAGLVKGAQSFLSKASQWLSNPANWWSLGQAIINGVKGAIGNIGNWFQGLGKGMEAGYRETRGGYKGADTRDRQAGNASSLYSWSRAKGGLGDAVASELKNKPLGSDLVIANSSETVIPAAGGYGMLDFVETLRSGFNSVVNVYKETQAKQDSTLKTINATLVNNQQQTNAKFAALSSKMTTPSMPGGLGGAAAGGVDAFTPIAQKYGLQMTSGYRPGDPGWHGANRARDFSNGTGPTPQMMQFAQYLASSYGSNLKELIYTPLGFSIKNGQKVAPYAQGAHYNHVHVAYAMGLGQGVAFNSLSGAQAWEKSMVSGSVKVGSVTGNSAEGFGGGTNVTNNITINQQPGQDADELAAIVAIKIGEAVADARAASIFV